MATVKEFVRTYSEALSNHNAAVLIGAGLSIPAGLVNWKDLMRTIAADIGLDVEKEDDLVAVAQYHLNERGGRQRINQVLVSEFSGRAQITENHRILARLPIETYWTTNYDRLIEQALEDVGKRADIKTIGDNLATTLPRRDAVVYKMHGDISDPASAVVTKDDYESYSTTRRGQLFSTALRGDLISKTFLCLGFSFSDPNLDYILGRIRILLEGNRREHYCLMRKLQRSDFKTLKAFQYACTKQELQVKDLRRYGIMAVMLDCFDEFTQALKLLEQSYRSRQIFISGSACEYKPWPEHESQQFLTLLGKRFASKGLNVITGFGLGVGPHIINGVLDELEKEGTNNLGDRLTLRPFPYTIKDPQKRKSRWTAYREEMISRAGVAVFVFGNKAGPSGEVITADGMLEEFEIASRFGLLLVPVGATGHVAKILHQKVSDDFKKYYKNVSGLRSSLAALDQPGTPSQLVDRILKFISLATEAA